MAKYKCNICGWEIETSGTPGPCPQCRNNNWSEIATPEWVECDPVRGTGGTSVEVVAQENTDSARSKTFTVKTASGLTKEVSVSQKGAGERIADVFCLLNTALPKMTRVLAKFQDDYTAPVQIVITGLVVFVTNSSTSEMGELSQSFRITVNSGSNSGMQILSTLVVPEGTVLTSVNLQKSTAECMPDTYGDETFTANWTTPPAS